ncbi:MAG: HAD family hydrolase [Desertimonas sp.]
MTARFDVVAFDADDTLWHSEDSFDQTENWLVDALAPYVPEGVDVREALRATEKAHIPVSGYGVKAYTLSMVTVAVTVTNGELPSTLCGEIVERGLDMLMEPVRLLDHVPEVLAALGRRYRLALVTKGDLVHQWRKVRTSGLAHHFELIEVVMEKDVDTYARVIDLLGVEPSRFCMVGNSVPSDVLPVLALGGHAVHVPYHITWDHELADHDEDLDELASIDQLPELLGRLDTT